MKKKLTCLLFGISAIMFASIFSFTLSKSSSTSNIEKLEINLHRDRLASDESDDKVYGSYAKYYKGEVEEGEKVTFATVVDYAMRLYDFGFAQYNELGYEKLQVYRSDFSDFYTYWYQQSGFYEETLNHISETRPVEIETLSNAVIDYVDNNQFSEARTKVDELKAEITIDAATLDAIPVYGKEFSKSSSGGGSAEAGADYYLTYRQYVAANNPDGSKTITYTEVTKQIHNLLKEGIRRYEAGESDYYTPFSNSYGFWYETSGFERKTMAYISGSRVTAVELQFATMKSAVSAGKSVADVEAEVNTLIDMLTTDAKKLDDILGYNSGSSSGLTVATFVVCLTIIIREGLEAILIVGAIIAYLIKTGNKKQTKFVYIGAGVAIVASVLLAFLLSLLNLTGVPQEIIEGVTALIAVAVLIYVSNWIISKAESESWNNYISSKVSASSEKGKMFTLAFTSFLAVFREGAEVILFYQPLVAAAKTMEHGMLAVFGGLALGLLVVGIVFALIRIFSVKVPLKPFFTITSVFMAVMAVIFLGQGIWELFIDGGIWPVGIIKELSWMAENEVLNFFGIYPTWLTIIPQIILTIVFVITFIIWIRKGQKIKKEAAQNKVEETEAPKIEEVEQPSGE